MNIPDNSVVKCETCGAEMAVNFEGCLLYGWPKCHGLTMTLTVWNVDLKEAMKNCLPQQLPTLAALKSTEAK